MHWMRFLKKTVEEKKIETKKSYIAFIGMSHLGLVVNICLSSLLKSKNILALDKDKNLINKLNKNALPFYEPKLDDFFKKNGKYIKFSSDFNYLKEVSCIFLVQDASTNNKYSTNQLDNLIKKIIPYLNENVTIIIMSQVPVGFSRKLYEKIRKKYKNMRFFLYYWLNTLIVGDAVSRFLYPERIIIGHYDHSNKMSPVLTQILSLFSSPIINMSYESAEITKSAINLYLAASITVVNSLADFCERIGADINQIIPALQSDKRIGPFAYLRPTLRISGRHLERELFRLKQLSTQVKVSSEILDCILRLNKNRYLWAIKKLNNLSLFKNKQSSSTNRPKICIWGLSYKKDTDSTVDAPSIKLIQALNKKTYLNVYDPKAHLPKELKGFTRFNDMYKALKGCQCLLILTDWDEFLKADLLKIKKLMTKLNIIDCVGALANKINNLKDFNYISIGVGIPAQEV